MMVWATVLDSHHSVSYASTHSQHVSFFLVSSTTLMRADSIKALAIRLRVLNFLSKTFAGLLVSSGFASPLVITYNTLDQNLVHSNDFSLMMSRMVNADEGKAEEAKPEAADKSEEGEQLMGF